MTLYFITGNKNKFNEALSVIPELKQLDLDLPELQDMDAHKIIEAKLFETLKHKKGSFIVEDTSLYIKDLKGLPGPLAKWFLKTVGAKGIYDMAKHLSNLEAKGKTLIGYSKNNKEIYFFEGIIKGKIVSPEGILILGGILFLYRKATIKHLQKWVLKKKIR